MRVLFVLILVGALVLAGCGGADARHAPPPSAAPVPVEVATVSSQSWPDVYEATGTVRARTAAVMSSKVMAYVRQVAVQAGDRVTEGQEVITLDAKDLDANVRRAEAAEAEVRSGFAEADNAMAGA